jgi:DNA polymerase-1
MSAKPRGGVGSLFLIDANNFMFRAYHGLPMLTSPEGVPVNAVHGYTRMIQAVRKEFAPEFFLAVFDAEGGKSRRREIFPEYKANRPPPPDDLLPQIPLVRQATDALGVPQTEAVGFEADDVIASYVEAGIEKNLEVVIVSSDKDLMQLVRDGDHGKRSVGLWDTMKLRLVGPKEVRDKFGVPPELLGDLLALAGDSSDNIPGVPGIGPKTAAALLAEFGTLEAVLTGAETIKQKKRRERLIEHAQDARISRELVELDRDAPLPLAWDDIRDRGSERAAMEAFFGPLGFKSTLAGAVSGSQQGGAPRGGGLAVRAAGTALEPSAGVTIDHGRYRAFATADREAFVDYCKQLRKYGRFSFQLELTHDEAMRAEIVGIALASNEPSISPAYVPVGHRTLSEPPGFQMPLDEVLEHLGPLLRDRSIQKISHAHKSQGVVLARQGIELQGVWVDPMLASYTLDPARSSHELRDLSNDLFGHKPIPIERVVGKGRKRVGFDQVAVDQAMPYSAERAELALHAGRHLASLVEQGADATKRLFHEIEMPLAKVLQRLELRGIKLDPTVLEKQAVGLGEQLSQLREEIEADAGYPINPESPQQLQKLLFEERGLPTEKKTKTGYSTDAQTLEKLSLLDPIVKLILDHRSLQKLKGTYLDALPKLINPKTGRLHTQFRQAVAQTGRLSSRDPNLQNIPIRSELGKRVREGFVAPEGMLLVSLDYSQIELRVLAHLSADPNLTSAFKEGVDVHRRTAAEVFGVNEDEVTDKQRSIAKAVNFGVVYGQTAFGLSRGLGIPQGRAGKYIKTYFERIPGVDAYMRKLIDDAKRRGFSETIFGRRRRIPELKARGAAKAYGERIARNTPIQGSAADIMKIAMVEVERRMEKVDYARMLLTVHDELIFECKEGRVDDLVALAKPAMEGAAKLDVPMVVEHGAGANWAAAKG